MEHLITSKANPRFKDLLALLRSTGAARTHTLLLGEKLIETWLGAPHTDVLVPESLWLTEGMHEPGSLQSLGLPIQGLSEKTYGGSQRFSKSTPLRLASAPWPGA